MSKEIILVLNAGSSSLKFALFAKVSLKRLLAGNVERIGLSQSFISLPGNKKGQVALTRPVANHQRALEVVLGYLAWRGYDLSKINEVGHRVVHGGEEFIKPILVDKKVIKRIANYNKLAPLHNPINISVIQASLRLLPKSKSVACFDTEWYKDMPPAYYLYSLPLEYYQKYRIRQYGFHGLSHEYVAEVAAQRLNQPLNKINLITCHLGSGSSITAVKQGSAIETSMGMTPLAGLSMSSRSGDLDANIPLYMIRELKISPRRVQEILNFESGWQGLAGTSDFRQIMVDAGYRIPGFKYRSDKLVRKLSYLVLNKFVNEVKFYIGGYRALLGKVNAVVFTGAIGERNKDFRQLVIKGLDLKGIKVMIIDTNEELMIARKIKRVK